MATTKIEKFTPDVCAKLTARLNDALAPIGDELGLRIMFRGGGYTAGEYKPKLVIQIRPAEGAVVENLDAQSFRMMAPIWGLTPDDLGRTFKEGGHTFQITGARPRSQKRPILVRREDGREYTSTVESVKRALVRESGGAK